MDNLKTFVMMELHHNASFCVGEQRCHIARKHEEHSSFNMWIIWSCFGNMVTCHTVYDTCNAAIFSKLCCILKIHFMFTDANYSRTHIVQVARDHIICSSIPLISERSEDVHKSFQDSNVD